MRRNGRWLFGVLIALAWVGAQAAVATIGSQCQVWDLPIEVRPDDQLWQATDSEGESSDDASVGRAQQPAMLTVRRVQNVVRQSRDENATPAMRSNRHVSDDDPRNAVLDAMLTDDVVAFRAAIAAIVPDPAQRRQPVFRQLHLFPLMNAFDRGAAKIVDQLLAWDPTVLADMTQVLRDAWLEDVIAHWLYASNKDRDSRELDEGDAEADRTPKAVDSRIAADHLHLVKLLTAAGAVPKKFPTHPGNAAFDDLARLPPSPEAVETIRWFLHHGVSINDALPDTPTPFALAARQQNVALVHLMMEAQRPSQLSLDQALALTPLVGGNPLLQLLLDRGADINSPARAALKQYVGPDMMLSAAERYRFKHDIEPLELVIKYKADPNRTPSGMMNFSALTMLLGEPRLALSLLDLGADPNWHDSHGNTALLQIANRANGPREKRLSPQDRARLVASMLAHGANPNAQNQDGVTPLMEVSAVDTPSVDLLLQAGAVLHLGEKDISIEEYDSKSKQSFKVAIGPIEWALLRSKDYLARALLVRSKRLEPEDCGAVFYAAASGSEQTLNALLDLRANAALVSQPSGHTPLHAAAARGETQTVRILLDRRAARVDEATARVALTANEIAENLAAYHVLVTATGGETALMMAALEGHVDVVNELLRHGAEVNHHDYPGNSALSLARAAAHSGKPGAAQVEKILLAHGATT